ncbi:TPA: gamma-glutamyltransferase [Klebsiella pneumoniae]|nr:gamma-glutamyltransferase [Klebsiella pneumoniae]HCQ9275030.1 gamma-glutamyltransferase [Klebsiella pneumoniae]
MIKTTIWRQVVIAALLAGGSFTVAANPPPPPPVSYGVEEDVFHPVRARQGMVASVDALATRVGVDILRQGGNAVDAAVAVGYALAVTHPQAGNIGGGGFMMLRTKDGKTTAIDFREMAPEQATRDMFLDDQGNPDSKKSLTSHLASGTPGSVAGFSLALEKYGTMPLNKVIRPGKLAPYESNQTTHFSVVDKDGNAVAVTYTLNTTFGTGIVAGDSGILLNNQMDDFSAKPGVPNVYGLVGGDANAVEPKKRPLSSMSPTIVVKDGKTWLVTGSPGGSRIITTVLQMVVNTIDFGMNVAEATNAPRFHHQWLPDELRVEKGFSPDTLKLLEAKGQKVALKEAMGSTQSIMVGPDGMLYGASDPRSPDDLTAGY